MSVTAIVSGRGLCRETNFYPVGSYPVGSYPVGSYPVSLEARHPSLGGKGLKRK